MIEKKRLTEECHFLRAPEFLFLSSGRSSFSSAGGWPVPGADISVMGII